MNSDDRFWNRNELYQEVWSTPMWTLAKKYGISDVGLAKVCRKYSGQGRFRADVKPQQRFVIGVAFRPEPASLQLCANDLSND